MTLADVRRGNAHERREDDDSLRRRQVEVVDRGDHELSQPRQSEDALREDRSADTCPAL